MRYKRITHHNKWYVKDLKKIGLGLGLSESCVEWQMTELTLLTEIRESNRDQLAIYPQCVRQR